MVRKSAAARLLIPSPAKIPMVVPHLSVKHATANMNHVLAVAVLRIAVIFTTNRQNLPDLFTVIPMVHLIMTAHTEESKDVRLNCW